MQEIQRHYFNVAQSVVIEQHHMEVIPGWQTSIANHDEGLMLNVELKHKLVRSDNCLQMIQDAARRCRNEEERRRAINKMFLGEIVMTKLVFFPAFALGQSLLSGAFHAIDYQRN